MLALLGHIEAISLGSNVDILGGSGQQSIRVNSYIQQFWAHEHAPHNLLAGDATKHITLSNGAVITSLMASQTSVRGSHSPRLRLDEVDEMDLGIFKASTGITMDVSGEIGAQTVCSSTHQYPDGTMQYILEQAAEKGWPVHEWCYKETLLPHGWLPESEMLRKRTDMDAETWRIEVELGEPSIEGRALVEEDVNAMFGALAGHYLGTNGEYIESEAPVEGAMYSHGADWARKDDKTEIITLRVDCEPIKLVAYESVNRQSWPDMARKLHDRIKRYGGVAAHDATGLGDVVADILRQQGLKVSDGGDWNPDTTDVYDYVLTGQPRATLFNDWRKCIESREVQAPMIEGLYKQYKYAKYIDLWGSGHPQDGYVAGALAYWARQYARGKRTPSLVSMTGLSRWH